MEQKDKEILISINELCMQCGFFTSDTCLNGGYGCNHKNCDDGAYIYKEGLVGFREATLIVANGLTKRNIKCNRRLSKKFIKKATLLLSREINGFGVKFQGACYAFSCPLGRLAYPEDFARFGRDPEDMGDDEYVIIETEKGI